LWGLEQKKLGHFTNAPPNPIEKVSENISGMLQSFMRRESNEQFNAPIFHFFISKLSKLFQ
jgi:hypothetical protein